MKNEKNDVWCCCPHRNIVYRYDRIAQRRFHLDDISDQEYRISLNEAAAIAKKETKKHNISSIHFAVEKELDNPTNATYEYQFFCEGQVIAVNPSTGKATVRNHTEKTAEPLFDIEKTEEFKQPQAAMKEAVSCYGKKQK